MHASTPTLPLLPTLHHPRSVLFTSFAVAAIGGAKLSQKFLGQVGWNGLINGMSGVAPMGLVLLNLL